jgi:hypothetical protein
MNPIVLKILSFILFSAIVTTTTAQTADSVVKKTRSRSLFDGMRQRNHKFPGDFVGNWKGELKWYVSGKPVQTFSMRLNIQPTDSAMTYTWQIIYGENGNDNRPYLLKPVDTAKGHWIVDERDGIILDSYVHGAALHGAFTVQGNTIVDNYSLESSTMMRVEFFTIKLGDKKTSGKGTEDVPNVDSYRVASYQTGTLFKVKEKLQKQ